MDGTDETRPIASPVAGDEATAVIDTRHHQLRPGYLALVFCAVAAAGFLIGIAVAAASRPKPPQIGAITMQQTIGPTGGTVRFENGQIEIPVGALAQPTRIVIRRSSFTDRVRVMPAGGSPEVFDPGGLTAYSFGPAAVSFRRTVQIVFRLAAGSRNGTAFARTGNDIVILGGAIDPDRQTVTVTVHDFRFAHRGNT